MVILKFLMFVCAYTAFSTGYSVSSPDVLALWDRAVDAIKFQQQANISELNEQLKGQVAPPDFLSVHQTKKHRWESNSDYQNRILIPELLCEVGWDNTLFLMSTPATFQQHFKTDSKLSPCQRHYITKDHLVKLFTSIEAAAEKGQLGVVLCFMHYDTSAHCQWNFTNGFFRYCQKDGYTDFTKHIFDNSHVFFKNGNSQLSYSLQGKCFVAALRNCHPNIAPEQEISNFKKLTLNQEYVDELYQGLIDALHIALATNKSYRTMDLMADYDSWPQPSIDAKNSAQQEINAKFQAMLAYGQYCEAKNALSRENHKPDQAILHTFLAKAAHHRAWPTVGNVLANMYDESITVPQGITDDLFVCATAYNNDQYFGLLTGENTFAVLTGENWTYGPPTPAAFDRALSETVRFRDEKRFDHFLDVYGDKLSETGLRTALLQAAKPTANSTLRYDITSFFQDNHYEERLKKRLGIPTRMQELIGSFDLNLELYVPKTAVFDIAPILIESILIEPILVAAVDPQISEVLPEQLDNNNPDAQEEDEH